MSYLWMILAGAFLVNCVPHLSAGLRGEAFPTPFAKPPARGLSSPRTNMLWGSGNLVVGIVLARTGWPMLAPQAAQAVGDRDFRRLRARPRDPTSCGRCADRATRPARHPD